MRQISVTILHMKNGDHDIVYDHYYVPMAYWCKIKELNIKHTPGYHLWKNNFQLFSTLIGYR